MFSLFIRMSKEPKKKLLVKIDEPINNEIIADVPLEPILDIPLKVKIPKKQKEGFVDNRGKSEKTLCNLQKGRDKLEIIWAEKRIAKAELVEKAINKKISLKEREKEKIMKEFGIDTLSEDDDVIEAPPTIIKKVKKVAPIKKKAISYVEEEESSEEEVVYVKREKKAVQPVFTPPCILFY